MKTYLDGNSIGYAAAQRKGKKLSAGAQETTAIYGAITTVRKLMEARVGTAPVVLWDGRSWRHSVFSDYKGNRTATPEQVQERERYKAQKAFILRAFHCMGMSQLLAANMEADDLAAILTRDAVSKGIAVGLITGDKDWLQLVQPGVVWIDHKMDRKCTAAEFHKFTGFRTITAFTHAKALQGDTGDNIKPRTGVGEDGAIELFGVFDDVHDLQRCSQEDAVARWLAAGKSCPKGRKGAPVMLPTKYQKLRDDAEVRARFEWALELVDLNHHAIPAPVGLRMSRAPVDVDGFTKLCMELGFASILRNVDAFLKPFVSIQEIQSA